MFQPSFFFSNKILVLMISFLLFQLNFDCFNEFVVVPIIFWLFQQKLYCSNQSCVASTKHLVTIAFVVIYKILLLFEPKYSVIG